MKKIIFFLTALLSVSCEQEEIFILEEEVYEVECHGDPRCTGYYDVDLWFNEDGVPKEAIIAHDGFRADLGEMMTFEATDVPGWKFIGFRKLPNSYCEWSPLVDEDNPRITYTYMHEKYMGNCNIGPRNIRLYAEYIKVFN